MSRTPLAFMSYVNDDDKYANGNITKFREHLSRAVKAHRGKPFEIFQDKNDIKWGQQWQERINDALDATLFLIPIITPSFFNSTACRDELERFLKREAKLGRNDLILPVYYIECPVLSDKAKQEHDTLAQIIAARQYTDWSDLRDDSFTTRKVRKALEKLAQQIIEALERSEAEAARAEAVRKADAAKTAPQPQKAEKDSTEPHSSANTFQSHGGQQNIAQGSNAIGTQINYYGPQVPIEAVWQMLEENKPQPVPPAKPEPSTLVVDAMHRGDYATITEAIKAAKAGTRILVRPGLYKEGVVIDKPVELVGDGDRNEIVIEAFDKHTVVFQATVGRLANLTLRQAGGKWCGVNVTQGRLELEDCDISSQGRACVAIHGSADPNLRRNHIHDGKGIGVSIYRNGKGMLEDNEIFANAKAGVAISQGGNPTLRRNHIYKNSYWGIRIEDKGGGLVEGNIFWDNAFGAWDIDPDCKSQVQRRENIEHRTDFNMIKIDCEANVQRRGNKE